MSDWKIFQGNRSPHDEIAKLPPPPSWRQFSSDDNQESRGAHFQARPEEIELVNAALYLRRPLLVTGNPGTGKTSLAYAVAYELKLGEVLCWPITTRTTLKDGLYYYDAIGRLQDAQQQVKDNKDKHQDKENQDSLKEIGKYIQLGPLGTALLPSNNPRVLLIDEIDKSDIDLPNDLLHVFEEGKFEIPELVRISEKLQTVEVRTAYKDETETTYQDIKVSINQGRVHCKNFPFVILTSNGERDFPPAFLRRCLRLNMKEPDEVELEKIVAARLGKSEAEQAKDLIKQFVKKREKGDLATDQLLNAIYLMTRKYAPVGQEKEKLVEQLLKYLNSSEER
ncbi:MAG: MoxR family ATPase [Scytonema sp. PMC 1069.18]|nr:MoxR family ATPase [Scytonema sp. PMC 1069.18]MEC4885113.1 MoxR family ATPase [Scytonema sp. PMC 1070.18]